MKKRTKITFSFILVVCLFLSLLPGAAPVAAVEADEAFAAPITENAALEAPTASSENTAVTEDISSGDVSILYEDISLRKEYEKHFLMSDGSYQAVVYSQPVHELVDGTWVEIQSTNQNARGNVTTDTTKSNIIDNYVLQGGGVQNKSLDRLYIGNRSAGLTRAYIQFAAMPTIPEGSTITAATMTLHFTSGTSTAANASAYQVTEREWASGEIQWSNKPAAEVLLQSNISHNNVTGYTFSCLTAVRHWYDGDTTGQNENYGIMLRYYDETTDDYNAVYSADYTDAAKRPALTITYQTATGIIADGVYYIRSSGTGLYLGTSGGITENTSVKLLSNATGGLAQVRQLWKVTYLGSGYYSIRPLHKLDMGLHVTSNNVDITTTEGTADSLGDVLSSNRWKLTAASGERCYISNADAVSYAMTYPNGVISPGINAITASNTQTSSFEWEFISLDDATSGLVLYDTSTSAAVVNPARYITEGETCTLGEYKLQPMIYSAEGLQTASLQWTCSGTAVDVSATTGKVTGWGYSTASTVITGTHAYGSVQFTVSYLDIREGTYFFRNDGSKQYVELGTVSAGAAIGVQDFDGGSGQSWILDHLGDGYFYIKAATASSVYYLGVQDNSAESGAGIVLQNGPVEWRTRWKLEETGYHTEYVSYKITPDCGESGNMALTQSGTVLEQSKFVAGDCYDEWTIHLHKDYSLMYLGRVKGEYEIQPVLSAVNSALITDAELEGYACLSMDAWEAKQHLASSKIFSCVTHGLQDGIKAADVYLSVSDINALSDDAFDDLVLVHLGACWTGLGKDDANNLVNALYDKGADVVIGFTVQTDHNETYVWTEAFMKSIAKGNTVAQAMTDADKLFGGSDSDGDDIEYTVSEGNRYIQGSDLVIPCP